MKKAICHKDRHFTPPRYVIVMLLFVSGSSLNAQSNSTNQICLGFNVSKIVKYGIPTNSSADTIAAFDLANIRPYTENSLVSYSIDQAGKYSQTIIYPNGHNNPDKWIKGIYRSETVDNVVSLFDVSNNLIFSDTMGGKLGNNPMTSEQISNFGYSEPITVPTFGEIAGMVNEGFIYTSINNKHMFLSDSLEIILAPLDQNLEYRILLNGLVQLSNFEQLMLTPNEKYVPAYRITRSFLPVSSSSFRIQKMEKEVFTNYSFSCAQTSQNSLNSKESKQELLNQTELSVFHFGDDKFEKCKYTDCNFYPNPAKNLLNFEVPTKENFNIEILNETGQIISKYAVSSSNLTINISNIVSGNYFVRMSDEKVVLCKKLVIQK